MVRLLIRLLVNAASIWAAAYLVDGVVLDTRNPSAVLLVALVFGVVNALLKPLLRLFSLPFILFTLGLFTLIINAALFSVTAYLTEALSVSGFGAALWGAVVTSVVSWLLGAFVDDKDRRARARH
ncbi:MAG: phage holin family protein [Pseudomonadota bacterium]